MAIDYTTPLGQVRALIGDTNETALLLADAVINAFLSIVPFGSIFQAAAMCCESLATKNISNDEKIGDYQIANANMSKNYLAMAQAFRDYENETPAFATIEDNLSGFNELTIIRNYILRTET